MLIDIIINVLAINLLGGSLKSDLSAADILKVIILSTTLGVRTVKQMVSLYSL